jgi:phospholipid-transporting ATPase
MWCAVYKLCQQFPPVPLQHGHLSQYRLSRLIRYSFYKNIQFGALLFYYQFMCGFSGQAGGV